MDSVLERAPVRRAVEALTAFGLTGQVKVLAETARTAADAAQALGVQVGQIASSLVFLGPNDAAVLVVTSGRHRVNPGRVISMLGIASLARADADFVKQRSGYSVGGVAPMGWLAAPVYTLVDEALAEYDTVWAAAGHPHAVFQTTFSSLMMMTGGISARVAD
jgi:prolyl-tRNA editing enzyme YbaK/EbsC (Cys-tRNA(Pro) deacylase)